MLENAVDLPGSHDPVSPTPSHLPHLEGIRALAALQVLVSHCLGLAYPVPSHAIADPSQLQFWVLGWAMWGHFAVTVFIVVSGYCLMKPVVERSGPDYRLRRGVAGFFKSRIKRIVPPYLAGLALSMLLIALFFTSEARSGFFGVGLYTWKDVLYHLLLIQNLTEGSGAKINGSYWSISVEMQIYLVLPLLVLVARRTNVLVAVGWLVFGSLLAIATGHHLGLHRLYPQYYAAFGIGALAAAIVHDPSATFKRLRNAMPWDRIGIAMGLVVFIGTRLLTTEQVNRSIAPLDLVTAMATAILLAGCATPGVLTRALSWKPLAFAGTFSYSIYLIHQPIEQCLWIHIVGPIGLASTPAFYALSFLSLAVILPAAYLFYLVAERPFLNTKRA